MPDVIQMLVVDDDPWILKMVSTALEKRGYRVHTAADGEEAYYKAIELRPDLIITDIMMPRMDGWTLVRSLRLRADLANTPVIFLSALTSDEDRIQGFRLGADDYLPKPFRFEELDLRVGNALRKRRLAPEPQGRAAAAQSGPGPAVQKPVSGPGPALPQPPAAPHNGIRGQLDQLGLSSLLIMVEMERKSGILVLRRGTRVGRIFIKMGKVIAARLDGDKQRGPEAVYELLEWPDGSFDFNTMDVDMVDEMNGASTQFLLMEGARLIDEKAAGAGHK